MFYLFTALMIAIFSLFPSTVFGLGMKLGRLFSLVIYAATLPSILILILTILIPNVPFDTAGMIGTILYTYIILNDIRKEIRNGGNVQ
jgi:ABC-type transport system involved in multi-copper enzyme maturation permease subunit